MAAGRVSAQRDRKPFDPRPPPYPQRGPPMPDEEEFALDPATIKILASDTRLALLRLLRERRMTLTEMAAATSLHKATVLEHLERLHEAGLVKRHDDPERIWVYYELTRRGSRIVNPGRTRFYLLVGAGVLAAGLAIALLAVLASLAPPVPPASTSQGGSAEADYLWTTTDAYGDRATLLALAEAGEPGPRAAFLVPEADATAVARGTSGPQGFPLEVQRSGGQVTLLAEGVPAGSYRLLVIGLDGGDNRGAMPAVRIAPVVATAEPATWWLGLDGPARFRVAFDGAPAEGNLTLVPADRAAAGLTLGVAAGQALAAPEALDALGPGAYELRFAPAGGVAVRAGNFTLRDPQVAVTPREVLAGATSTLRVALAAGPGLPLEVRADAARLVPLGSDPGGRLFALTPDAPGTLALHLGRLEPILLRAHPYARVSATVLPGPQLELALEDAAARPWAGTPVLLDGAPVGATNASGHVALAMPAAGDRTLTLQLPGGATVQRTLRIEGWNVTDAPASLEVMPRAEARPGQAAVDVEVRNPAGAAVPLTLLATLDGAAVDTASLHVPARGVANATLAATAAAGPHALAIQALPLAQPPLAFANRTAPPASPPLSPPPSPPSPPTGTPPSSSPPPSPPATTPPSTPSSGSFGGAPLAPTALPVAGQTLTIVVSSLGFEHVDAEADLAPLPNPQRQGQLDQKNAAKTPGFEALGAALAVAVALAAARRRRG